MIELTRSYTTSDGTTHPNLAAAQNAELKVIIGETTSAIDILNVLVKRAPEVVDILTLTEKSRLKARKAHGAVRTKKSKVAAPDNGVATG